MSILVTSYTFVKAWQKSHVVKYIRIIIVSFGIKLLISPAKRKYMA